MREINQDAEVYIEMVPTLLRHRDSTGELRSALVNSLVQEFSAEASTVVDRWSRLTDLCLAPGPHVPLLLEARILFLHGHFYYCVAMCGITSERIVKDLLRDRLALRADGKIASVPEHALEELERFELSAIARFLEKAGVVDSEVRSAILNLAQLRNKYAHGAGKNAEADALRAISLLHEIINRTVSLFKDFQPPEYGPRCDVVEGASGAFGFEPSNPIPGDAREYCNRLHCPSGHPYWFQRLGSLGRSSPDGHISDKVQLLCFGGEHAILLFFDIYHAEFSMLTPTGLTLEAPEGRGIMGRVPRFPEDLATKT